MILEKNETSLAVAAAAAAQLFGGAPGSPDGESLSLGGASFAPAAFNMNFLTRRGGWAGDLSIGRDYEDFENDADAGDEADVEEDGATTPLSPPWPVIESSEHAKNTINPIRRIVDVMNVKPNPEKELIRLNIGDPSVSGVLPTHPSVLQAVVGALYSGAYNGYGPAVGFADVRQAVADHVNAAAAKSAAPKSSTTTAPKSVAAPKSTAAAPKASIIASKMTAAPKITAPKSTTAPKFAVPKCATAAAALKLSATAAAPKSPIGATPKITASKSTTAPKSAAAKLSTVAPKTAAPKLSIAAPKLSTTAPKSPIAVAPKTTAANPTIPAASTTTTNTTGARLVTADDVVLASGCSHALQMCLEALCNAGQNVLVPRPGFPLYGTLLRPLGVAERRYDLLPERAWQCDLASMERLIDADTAAIVVNNPSNPCGAVYSRTHLRDVLRLAEYYRVPVIADEIYGGMTYGGARFRPMASLAPRVPVLTCDGISKRYLVPGWRLGWIIINDVDGAFSEIRDAIRQVSQKIVGPCALIQGALPSILRNTPDEFFENTCNVLSANADIVVKSLSSAPGLRPIRSQGAMYIMINVDMACFPHFHSELAFTQAMLSEESVYCLPGSAFHYPGSFRIVLTSRKELVDEACRRIRSFCLRHYSKPVVRQHLQTTTTTININNTSSSNSGSSANVSDDTDYADGDDSSCSSSSCAPSTPIEESL